MKKYLSLVLVAAMAAIMSTNSNAAGGFKKQPFQEVFYFEHGGKGDGSGRSADNAHALSTVDLYAIPADAVIERAYLVVDTAIAGTVSLDIGDDDDADGYCPNGSITLGTPGMYCGNDSERGAYGLATSNAKLKYYSAAGKEVKAAFSGASSAGKARVVIEGFLL